MQHPSSTLGRWERLWCKQNIIYWAFAWAALSLLTYIFFSGTPQNIDRPVWYRLFTAYILQLVPALVAGLLCIRNGLSRRMPSGSKVWLLIGITIISYLVGSVFFSSWELLWHLNSSGSLGDPFFCIFYIGLSVAMAMAITSKRVQLKIYQWLIVLGLAIYAAMMVMWILKPPATLASTDVTTPSTSVVQVQTATTRINSTEASSAPDLTQPASESKPDAPEWVMFFDRIFKPYGQTLNVFYVWYDVFLFVLAAMMILAFWGGRLSHAWQVNAQAIICFYIADMWFAYAGNQIKDYQAGFMLEVFWILGIIQFAVAASIEFEHMLTRKQGMT